MKNTMKKVIKIGQEHFKEVETKQEANEIDMDVWTFIGLKSDRYAFKRRVRK